MEISSQSRAATTAIRSTKGCWTCRLRKKKCDELRPCLRCKSVNIECFYGPKPKWIEDIAAGKQRLECIKVKVAASASLKRAAFRGRVRLESTASKRTNLLDSASLGLDSISSGGEPTGANDDLQGGAYVATSENEETMVISKLIEDQEANLIMHYLDHVFYIQFRFHIPSISAGGRGWLFSLLTRTKPLYHAALSLSAFHQQSLVQLERGGGETVYLQELERQHNLTLKELQLFIHEHSATESAEGAFDRNVKILACVVQLISFELFNGGVSNWQVHLRASADLVVILNKPALTGSSQAASNASANYALRFFTACVIWFDVIACISTRSPSYLGDHHSRLLLNPVDPNGMNIDLHPIIGCHNWVMIIISEIAALSAKKDATQEQIEPLEVMDFQSKASELHSRLDSQRQILREELEKVRRLNDGTPSHSSTEQYNRYTVLVVTDIFSSAAIIYLQSVTLLQQWSTIQLALKAIMNSILMIPDPRMIRGLIWPLCVAGCMASSPSDQEFFRNAAAKAVNDSGRFGNSRQALDVLETSWRLQSERGYSIDCAATIREMGTCVLLV